MFSCVRAYVQECLHACYICMCVWCASMSVCNVLWAYVFAHACCFVYVHAFACICMLSRVRHCSLVSFHHVRFRSCAAIQEEIAQYKHRISREYRSWLSNGIVVDSASSVFLHNGGNRFRQYL